MKINWREMTIDDMQRLEFLLTSEERVFLGIDEISTFKSEIQSIQRMFARQRTKNSFKLLVGQIEGKDVCYLTISSEKQKLMVDHIYILKKYRNKGLAKEVLKDIIAHQEKYGLGDEKTLVAGVYKKNDASLNLFTSTGFKRKEDGSAYSRFYLTLKNTESKVVGSGIKFRNNDLEK